MIIREKPITLKRMGLVAVAIAVSSVTTHAPAYDVDHKISFASSLEHGDLVLALGQSIAIAMNSHKVMLNAFNSAGQRADSLSRNA